MRRRIAISSISLALAAILFFSTTIPIVSSVSKNNTSSFQWLIPDYSLFDQKLIEPAYAQEPIWSEVREYPCEESDDNCWDNCPDLHLRDGGISKGCQHGFGTHMISTFCPEGYLYEAYLCYPPEADCPTHGFVMGREGECIPLPCELGKGRDYMGECVPEKSSCAPGSVHPYVARGHQGESFRCEPLNCPEGTERSGFGKCVKPRPSNSPADEIPPSVAADVRDKRDWLDKLSTAIERAFDYAIGCGDYDIHGNEVWEGQVIHGGDLDRGCLYRYSTGSGVRG